MAQPIGGKEGVVQILSISSREMRREEFSRPLLVARAFLTVDYSLLW